MNQVKRYVPENLLNKLESLNYKHKEHLFIICDMIYRQSVFRKSDDKANDFVDIPRQYFSDILHRYKTYIDFLVDNDLIESDNKFSMLNGKAIGYRFKNSVVSKIIPVDINKKTLSRRIIRNRNKRLNLVEEKLKPYRDYFISTFNIDIDEAESELNKWYDFELDKCKSINDRIELVSKYNSIYIRLRSIADGELYFNRNQTNNRVDTNLTSLKSDYKKFISKKNLWQIDIVNSQPFFLCLYLYSNPSYVARFLIDKSELNTYRDWTCGGIFYEEFRKNYNQKHSKNISREEVKEMMFKIYYSKNGSFKKEKEIFSSLFPTIMKFIEEEKIENHSNFAIKLQKIESNFCIDNVCQKLDVLGIKYYGIHDSWLISEEYVGDVNNLIIESFEELYGMKPELKIEKIN